MALQRETAARVSILSYSQVRLPVLFLERTLTYPDRLCGNRSNHLSGRIAQPRQDIGVGGDHRCRGRLDRELLQLGWLKIQHWTDTTQVCEKPRPQSEADLKVDQTEV